MTKADKGYISYLKRYLDALMSENRQLKKRICAKAANTKIIISQPCTN